MTHNEVDKVVIFDKDRLLRFGFELVEYVASLHDGEVEIMEQELVEDLIPIVTVFSCRLQGKRANKAKKL